MLQARCLHIIRWVSLANCSITHAISGGRQSRHTFWGTHHGIFIGFLYFSLCCKRMVSEFNLQREMRKTENEQEGAHKTTQAGHSANPFMVSGCLFTAFYQVIILGDNLSDKVPLGKFSIINEKDAGFRGEKCYPRRCEMYVCCICSSFFCYVQCECFPFSLCLIDTDLKRFTDAGLEEIHPHLSKPDDYNEALLG